MLLWIRLAPENNSMCVGSYNTCPTEVSHDHGTSNFQVDSEDLGNDFSKQKENFPYKFQQQKIQKLLLTAKINSPR